MRLMVCCCVGILPVSTGSRIDAADDDGLLGADGVADFAGCDVV